jgi:hypothetical protein
MMTIRTNGMVQSATTRGRKEIFTVESRHATPSGKTIRRIVIFDNHPASLRLLTFHLTPRRQNELVYAALATLLALAIGLGIFWPLI